MASDPMAAFAVKNVLPMELFGLDISITNSSLCMFLVVLLVCALFWIGTSDRGLVPGKIQCVLEKLFSFTRDVVNTNAGARGAVLFPYLFALFLFIAFGNVVGLFPFAFSFTSQLVVTVGMAVVVFVSSIVIGLFAQGLGFFQRFCPSGVPGYLIPFFIVIELMSFLFRPLSLGIRLFANMVSGHIMIDVIAGFAASIAGVVAVSFLAVVPVAVDVLLNVFKLVVCMLQAYVFTVLSCMYLSESLEAPAH
ncbi:MAG: F0F1 ATP synthase subunit A [Alphaproteobacteria bacterium]|nr:F0F1 ATP synthase subunit A [Alphaproteobacteria bacterium]